VSVPDDYLACIAEQFGSAYLFGDVVFGWEFRIGSGQADALTEWAKTAYGTFSDGAVVHISDKAMMFGYPLIVDPTLPAGALIFRVIEVH